MEKSLTPREFMRDILWRECCDKYGKTKHILDIAEIFDNYLKIPNFENHLVACKEIAIHLYFIEMRYLIKKCRKLKLIWLVNSKKY